jgi:hypothetical protein
VERRLLQETALDHGAVLCIARLNVATGSQQLQHFVEIASGHGPDQRHMVRKLADDLKSPRLVGPAVVIKILLDELEPLGDARRHRRLDSIPVSLELIDDESRDEQLHLALVAKNPQCDDPPLSVSALTQVKPGGGVDEHVQHGTTLWALPGEVTAPCTHKQAAGFPMPASARS